MELKTPLYEEHVKAGGKMGSVCRLLSSGTVSDRSDQGTHGSTHPGGAL